MPTFSNIVEQMQRKLFKSVISNKLVYNTCWEDPRLDRQMLKLNRQSRILMLTSAGDNTLDYLLDKPLGIDCVDINPAQNALLEFKKVLFKEDSHHLLWEFFGKGKRPAPEEIYYSRLREHLPQTCHSFWDRHIGYFSATTEEPGFYFRGTSGKVALMMHKKIKRKGLYPQVLKLLNARSLEEQTYYFQEIEPQLWGTLHQWLVSGQSVMTMLGVPAPQRKLIAKNYKGGMMQYIRESLFAVFTRQPIRDNYFWRVYLTGSYTPDCCPGYLCEENFDSLARQMDKIQTHDASLLEYLKNHTGTYTHFVLLDHQDWLVDDQPEKLAETWKHILAASEPGSRILFRSAAPSADFLPGFVTRKVRLRPQWTRRLHASDRVGTYESTHLGIVQ